jgi:cytolysin-activating lysine-acyltransferase
MAHAPRTAVPARLGLAVTVMLGHERYRSYPLACLDYWTRPPVLLDQIQFYYSPAGDAVGYVTWAFLADDVAARLQGDPTVLLHLSEWNEGAQLWIMDLALPPGLLPRAAADLARRFAEVDEAHFLRRRADGSVRKVALWRRDRGALARRFGWSVAATATAEALPC